MTDTQIAIATGLSVRQVRSRRGRLQREHGAASRNELVQRLQQDASARTP
jgi:DNA-binding CsgD family transcriptional regulator